MESRWGGATQGTETIAVAGLHTQILAVAVSRSHLSLSPHSEEPGTFRF